MGSDFTRHCARLVIRIARSSSPSNVLPFHRMTLLCMFTIIQVVNTLLAVIELPAAQVLGYAEEQGLQGGYQVTLHS